MDDARCGAVPRRDAHQARQALQKAIDLAPASPDARIALANFQWATGDTQAAEATLRATLGMAPQNLDAHRALALLYLTTGRAKLAEPHFQALASDARGKLALADFYLGTKQDAAARRVLDELAAGDNKSHSRAARLRLASLAYSSGQKPEAHRLVDEILERASERRRRSQCQSATAARGRVGQGSCRSGASGNCGRRRVGGSALHARPDIDRARTFRRSRARVRESAAVESACSGAATATRAVAAGVRRYRARRQ